MSFSKTQMLLLENTTCIYYSTNIDFFVHEIHRVYIWPLQPFVFCLSFVNNSYNNETTPSTNKRFWPDSGQILRHQYGISVAESQMFLLAKHPSAAMSEEKINVCCSQAKKLYKNALYYNRLEVIIDHRSTFVAFRKIMETKLSQKESSFRAEVPLINLIGAANLQSPVVAWKFLPRCHRNSRSECVMTNVISAKLQGFLALGIPERFCSE